MKLLKLHIEGFGIFSERSVPVECEFAPGLVVIPGDNEAGKSTLLAFVRRIIYGFPDARTKENQYPPLLGGRHGGRILASDSEGTRVWIERIAGKKGGVVSVREDGGGELPETTLTGILGHMPAEVFGGIFAFGLAELAGLGALDQEELRDRIYSAGAGVAISPAKVAKEFDDRLAELLKQRAGKARINDAVTKLVAKQRELEALGDLQASYERVCGELADAGQDSSQLGIATEEKRQAQSRVERLIEARPHFVEWRNAEEDLIELGDQPFPESGRERYNRTKEKLAEGHSSLEAASQELKTTEDGLAKVQVDDTLLDSSEAIERLGRDLGKFQAAVDDLPKRETELEEAEGGLQDGLRDLGPDWTEGRLRDFDLSIPFREQIRHWKTQGEEARARLNDAQTKEKAGKDAVAAAKQARDSTQEVVQALSEPRARESIAERRQAVRQLRAGAGDLRLVEQEIASLGERIRDKETERQSLSQAPVGLATLPEWPALGFALVGLLGAVLLAAFRGANLSAILPIVLGLLFTVAYRMLRGWLLRLQERAEATRDIRLTGIDSAVCELRSKATNSTATKARLQSSLQESLAPLGLTTIPNAVEIERLDAELDGEQRQVDEWNRAQADLAKAQGQLDQAQRRLGETAEECEKAVSACASCEQGWKEWLRDASLSVSLSADGALEFLTKAESARETLRRIGDLRRRVEGIQRIIEEYMKGVATVLGGCGRAEDASASAVDHLVKGLAAARESVIQKRNLIGQLERLQAGHSALAKQVEELEKEKGRLFAAAAAKDEDDFLAAAAAATRRAELAKKRDDAEKMLENLLGSGAALAKGIQELEQTPPDVMEANAASLRDDIERLQGEAQEADRTVGELRQQIKGLETDERASQLRAEIRSLEEDVQDDGDQWATLAIARLVLRRTQDKYERERRPKVVEEAERFFREMTGDLYRLVSPPGETRLELESSDGRRKGLEQLSRGTAEQLYLSLRFGFICELAQQGQSLPVIMDDVLVNFDPQRANGAAKGIARLAESRQVILFTCHPETVELLQKVVPQVQICQL
jgi:uncharacterized protein YhaN